MSKIKEYGTLLQKYATMHTLISTPLGVGHLSRAAQGPIQKFCFLDVLTGHTEYTGWWVKLNGANAVFFVVVKHVLENCDNFGR